MTDNKFLPSYKEALKSGEFENKVYKLKKVLNSCEVCPRKCRVNRNEDEKGYCRTGKDALVASYCVHRGEEPPISGINGSGTVFFANCNLSCIFCQNYEISQKWSNQAGRVSTEELADIFLELEARGVHNINWVSPSHIVPQAVEALFIAAKKGLSIPVVYNSNGYDSLEILKIIDSLIDIYLPDLKYFDDFCAKQLSDVPNYVENAKTAVQEMWRQKGELILDRNGVAIKGVLVRHLVLPERLSQSEEVIKFLSEKISPQISLSLMSQYYPAHKAKLDPKINRPITEEEYEETLKALEKFGITKGFVQENSSHLHYRPDFSKDGHPFED